MTDEERLAFVMKLRARGIRDTNVLRALETIPRELFVPRRYSDLAGKDVALPLSCGQTTPSPYEVARLLETLQVAPAHRVLEIGTGSGFVSAILAKLAQEVVSIERFQALALEAKTRLATLKLKNVKVLWADGLNLGPEFGLFDRILVNGVVAKVPPSLLGALAVNGRLVAARPATANETPHLSALVHDEAGNYAQTQLGFIRATPMVEGVSKAL